MQKYFKKLFSILMAAIVLVTATVPSGAIASSKPGKPTFKIVKRAKKSVTLKIDKTKNATGYQIFISNSKNGKYQQTAASRIRTVKLTKLKKNKSYYVKVRAFKTVGYHITLGSFSKAIKVDKYSKNNKPEEPAPTITPVPDIPSGSAIEPSSGTAITYEPVPGGTGTPGPATASGASITYGPVPSEIKVPVTTEIPVTA